MGAKSGSRFGCLLALCGAQRPWNGVKAFFTSPPDRYVALKTLLGFPFGFLLGLGLYFTVITGLKLPEILEYILGGTFTVFLTVGYAISVQVRCISWLVVPTFFGKSGRSYIGAFALVYLLSGPVTNIMYNAQEATRSITCSGEIAQNQTKARLQLQFQPLHDVMLDLQKDSKNITEIAKELSEAFSPIKVEVEDENEIDEMKENSDQVDSISGGDKRSRSIDRKYKTVDDSDDAKKKEAKYERKLDYRCEDIFSMGVIHCRKLFKDAEEKCNKKMKIMKAVFCWPMKITAICEIVRVVPGVTGMKCNSMQAMDSGFGEAFSAAETAAESMTKNFKVNLQYQVKKNPEALDRLTAEEAAKAVSYELSWRQRWLDFLMTLFKRFTAFLFVFVLLRATSYHEKYVGDFRHDNFYITPYFRRVDARRRLQKKKTLLPMRKIEKSELMTSTKAGLTKREKKKVISGTLRLLLRVFTFVIIILVDRLIYEVLDIISRHSHIEYRQTGEHHIDLKIGGTGVLSRLLWSLLKGFNSKHTLDNLTSNFECLPLPKKTESIFYYKIGGVFLLVWLVILVEAYGLRLRPKICAFFYPKREKKRILFLYNESLKRRKGFFKHARHQVMRKAREQKLSVKTGFAHAIVAKFPRLRCCLRRWLRWKRNCLICDEKEKKSSVKCMTPGCNAVYCWECWRDIHRRCYACREADDWDSDTELTDLDL